MSKIIRINGTDYTDLFTPYGYTVAYQKIKGGNAGYLLDGSYLDDVLAVKTVVTCTCMPLHEAQLALLLAEITQTYAAVYFYDPKLKGYRTAQMMPSDPSQGYRGEGADTLSYWTGTTVEFTER